MYKISKDPDGIVLLCHDCSHVERIDLFDEGGGNRRTQAARAMQNHSRDKHGSGSVLHPIPRAHGATRLSTRAGKSQAGISKSSSQGQSTSDSNTMPFAISVCP
jgi:hypothetical protein